MPPCTPAPHRASRRPARRSPLAKSLAILALPIVIAACHSMPDALSHSDGVFEVPAGQTSHHKLRYRDGQVSDNDSCMIRLGNRLNSGVPPMYVNGQPVGFC